MKEIISKRFILGPTLLQCINFHECYGWVLKVKPVLAAHRKFKYAKVTISAF